MFNLLIVFGLVLLNGCFALSELAVVSARRPRLRTMAEKARPGAAAALALAEDPGRFLSAVQIGITLVGIVAGAFSGAALGRPVAGWLEALGVPASAAQPIGFGGVIAFVTYLSIVIGELVPKRLALSNPEGLACMVAPPMTLISQMAAPVVWLLDTSSSLIFGLFGVRDDGEERVTQEDVQSLVVEAERHGAIAGAERRMIAGVLRLADRPIRALMTPRGEVDWLDLQAGEAAWREAALTARHSLLPVGDGSDDALIGVVRVRDILAALARGEAPDLRALIRPAPVVPDTSEALSVLKVLREAQEPFAFVHDEYGHFEGVVTSTDLTGAIVGEFGEEAAEAPAKPVQRDDGSWLLDGSMHADEAAELLRLRLPDQRPYETLAGLVLGVLGRVPEPGAVGEQMGWRWEVVDMDGRRIDKVLVRPAGSPARFRRPGSGPTGD